ncbi:GNAT family N-acetyltransferase [Streptomyces sp. G45]|uniref:GNAT family N-acetyltransferase n=1 Tax=Streptomyces sp. G45 TaxID=3406627 RepID=UPI003C1A9EB1
MGVAIRRATEDDRADVVRLLDEAFRRDPVSTWLFPDEQHWRQRHGALMAAFLDIAFAEGFVDVAEDGSAAALWWSVPEGAPHEGGAVATETADTPAQLREAVDPDNERVELVGQLTSEAHPTDRAHQYLHLIAVRPGRQGEGIGTALVSTVLDQCDREGLHAYLEASSERSRRLYQRLGFTDVGPAVELPGGPRMWPMWREPRGS